MNSYEQDYLIEKDKIERKESLVLLFMRIVVNVILWSWR